MPLAFTDNLADLVITTQIINAGADEDSAEQDRGADTRIEAVTFYLDITGFASAPTGHMEVRIIPLHTSSGTEYNDGAGWSIPFTVDADQAYAFPGQISLLLPRYFIARVSNKTNVNTDASAVSLRLEYQKVTA